MKSVKNTSAFRFKQNIFQTALILFSILLINGCVNIKSDYPEIKYYRFSQEPPSNIGQKELPVAVQFRDFSISSQINPFRLMVMEGQNEVSMYYYFRWADDCSDMAKDFMIERFSNYNVFKGGVLTPENIIMPDYFVEGMVTDMMAYNTEDEDEEKPYVNIQLKISFAVREIKLSNESVLFTKVYKSKIFRETNKAETIAPAFSKALNEIADKLLTDIVNAIEKHRSS